MDAHIKLKLWWASTGAHVTSGNATAEAIDAVVRRYNLKFPEDFHRYLAEGAPVSSNWDNELGEWWPVGRIKNIPDEYSSRVSSLIPNSGQKFLFFLDHCQWSWAWAISCDEGETFGKIVLIGDPLRFVADSFTEFVDRYTTNWMSVV